MHSFARKVTKPRSPGPAPTKETFPRPLLFFLLSIDSFAKGGSRLPGAMIKFLRRYIFNILLVAHDPLFHRIFFNNSAANRSASSLGPFTVPSRGVVASKS